MQHLEAVFQAIGFPKGLVNKTLSSPQPTMGSSVKDHSHPEEEPPKILCTPYVHGVSERLEKVCASLGVKAVFKPQRTIRQMLVQVKEKTSQKKRKKWYMKCHARTHKYTVHKGDEQNGSAVHANKFNHSINRESAGVLRTTRGYWNRSTLESMQISQCSCTWKPLLWVEGVDNLLLSPFRRKFSDVTSDVTGDVTVLM